MKRTGLYWYNYDFLFDYDNEPCIARPTFVDLNPVELNYYLFIIVMLLMIYQLRSLFSVKQKCMKNVKIKCYVMDVQMWYILYQQMSWVLCQQILLIKEQDVKWIILFCTCFY